MNLGEIEFSVFQCKSKANIPAYYANIKVISFWYYKIMLNAQYIMIFTLYNLESVMKQT